VRGCEKTVSGPGTARRERAGRYAPWDLSFSVEPDTLGRVSRKIAGGRFCRGGENDYWLSRLEKTRSKAGPFYKGRGSQGGGGMRERNSFLESALEGGDDGLTKRSFKR